MMWGKKGLLLPPTYYDANNHIKIYVSWDMCITLQVNILSGIVYIYKI